MRKIKPTLIEVFINEPYKFSLSKALDLIYSYKSAIIIKDNFRFSSKYSQIAKVEGVKDKYIELYTNLPTIAGIDGSLPYTYEEDYILYNKNSKEAVLSFFNIFHSRYIKLYYDFLKFYDVSSISKPIENTKIGNMLINLSGYTSAKSFYNKLNSYIPIQFAIATHNLFWQSTRSANGLRILIKDFFDVPVKIEEFVPKLIAVSRTEQTKIGAKNYKYNELGKTSILDRKQWNITDNINIIIGPLSFEKYLEFLPKPSKKDQVYSNLQKLKDIIKMYIPFELTATIKIYLDTVNVKGVILNRSRRLNKDAFILGLHKKNNTYIQEVV